MVMVKTSYMSWGFQRSFVSATTSPDGKNTSVDMVVARKMNHGSPEALLSPRNKRFGEVMEFLFVAPAEVALSTPDMLCPGPEYRKQIFGGGSLFCIRSRKQNLQHFLM